MLDKHKSENQYFYLPQPRYHKPRFTMQTTSRTSYPATKRASSSHDRNITTVTKVVKLVGNMKQNIDDVLEIVGCTCGSQKQFRKIAKVYCQKIQKLRKQRDDFKNLYIQTLSELQQLKINKRQQDVQIQFCALNSVQNLAYPQQLQQFNKNIAFEQLASEQNLLLTDKSLNMKSPSKQLQQKNLDYYLDKTKDKVSTTVVKKNKRESKENQLVLKETKKNKNHSKNKHQEQSQICNDIDPVRLKYGITKKQLQQYIEGALWTKQMNENSKNSDLMHAKNFGKFTKGPQQKMNQIKTFEELGTTDSFGYCKRR